MAIKYDASAADMHDAVIRIESGCGARCHDCGRRDTVCVSSERSKHGRGVVAIESSVRLEIYASGRAATRGDRQLSKSLRQSVEQRVGLSGNRDQCDLGLQCRGISGFDRDHVPRQSAGRRRSLAREEFGQRWEVYRPQKTCLWHVSRGQLNSL